MGTTTPLGKPATRARIQNRQLAFRLDASQARQDSNLQPTVPKTVVLPIAPLAYTMRPMRPRWSRFARPITRWTPSAGAGGDGHCPPVRHHAPLGLPRQGGCRGEPATWIPMPADVHAWRGAYPCVPPVGFEPTAGRVETVCSTSTELQRQSLSPRAYEYDHPRGKSWNAGFVFTSSAKVRCVSSVLSVPSVRLLA